MSGTRRGLLIILSSPSGAGKSTLAKRLRAWDPDISFSVSATTRAMRPGEVDGQDYHFVSEEAFKELVRDGGMLDQQSNLGQAIGTGSSGDLFGAGSGRDLANPRGGLVPDVDRSQ